jgi:hypothetical protein
VLVEVEVPVAESHQVLPLPAVPVVVPVLSVLLLFAPKTLARLKPSLSARLARVVQHKRWTAQTAALVVLVVPALSVQQCVSVPLAVQVVVRGLLVLPQEVSRGLVQLLGRLAARTRWAQPVALGARHQAVPLGELAVAAYPLPQPRLRAALVVFQLS